MEVSSSSSMSGAITYKLREATTTEDLYTLLTREWQLPLPGKFELKKGLLGTFIRFDTYMTMQPRVKVKDNVVKISRVQVETQTNGMDVKATAQAIDVISHGGSMMDAMMAGPEYFIRVCAEVERILHDQVVT